MKRRISRRWARYRLAICAYGTITVLTVLLTSSVIGAYLLLPNAVSTIYGVPREIAADAIENDAVTVFFFADFEERHSFAKGNPTAYGSMPYDIEDRLRNAPYYWTDKQVHSRGFRAGFSELH